MHDARSSLWLVAGLTLACAACGVAEPAACGERFRPDERAARPTELRGVWVIPNATNEAARERALDVYQRLGVNTVFLLTPTVGEHRGVGDESDYEAMLDALKKRGVSVHGWLMNKRRTGEQADYTDPAEQAAQARWAVEVLDRWPALDGVHLDYIRFTDWEPPNAKKISGVTATVAAIRASLRAKHPKAKLTAAVFTADYSYMGGRWGADGALQWDGDVPAWYADWYAADARNVYATRPAAEHAAGRFKDFNDKHVYGPTFLHVQQDPVAWLRDDLLDMVIAMQYSSDRDRWRTEADTWKLFTGDRFDRVALGLGWLTEKGQPDWRYDAPALADHARYAQAVGLTGCSIYTAGIPGVDDESLIRALTGAGAPWAAPANSPLTTRDENP